MFTSVASAARRLSTSACRALAARAPKRFYDSVTVVQANNGGDFEVCLDQTRLKTPLGAPLKMRHEALARAVAQEWAAQEKVRRRVEPPPLSSSRLTSSLVRLC